MVIKIKKPRQSKSKFVDQELLETLKAHGFKSEKSKQAPAGPKNNSNSKKVVIKKSAMKGMKNVFSEPVAQKAPRKRRKKKAVSAKPKRIKEIKLSELQPAPVEEKKPGFFDKFKSMFKRSEKIPESVPEIKEEPVILKPKTEVTEEIVPEITPIEKAKEEKEITEIKEAVAEEPKIEIEEKIKEEKEEVETFPVPKEEQERKIEIKEEPAKEKKKGFFDKIKDAVGLGKSEAEELEPIQIISPSDELRYQQNANPVFDELAFDKNEKDHPHNEPVAKKSVTQVLKQEIMPSRKQDQQPEVEDKQNENRQNGLDENTSGMDILFSEKKKKPEEKDQ